MRNARSEGIALQRSAETERAAEAREHGKGRTVNTIGSTGNGSTRRRRSAPPRASGRLPRQPGSFASAFGRTRDLAATVLAALALSGAASVGVQAETGGGPAVDLSVATGAPLTALSVIPGAAVTCIQSAFAIDADGSVGVVAPQLGATVIRGSAATSPSVNWAVLSRDQVGAGEGALMSVCVPAR